MIQPSMERTAVALEWVVMLLFFGSCFVSSGERGASTSISVSAMIVVAIVGLGRESEYNVGCELRQLVRLFC